MSQLESFLQAIHEAPDDDTPRLIFADWLDEHGDAAGVPAASARAELIRVQCALAAWVPDHELRARLQVREEELLAEHTAAWVGDLPHTRAAWSFHRGLLRISIVNERFLTELFRRVAEPLLRTGWIEQVHLAGSREFMEEVASNPLLEWITALDLCNEGLVDRSLTLLVNSPHWQRLRRVALRNNELRFVPRAFADDKKWPHLEWLDLCNNFIPAEVVVDLLRLAGDRLKYLNLQGNPLGGANGEWIERRQQEPVSMRVGLPVRLVNSLGMEFALIPAGSFLMGSPESEAQRGVEEGPCHVVRITRPFYMSRCPVTREQYRRLTHADPSQYTPNVLGMDVPRPRIETLPVERVTRDNATDFCRRLGARRRERELGHVYRLPTEAEWEYACRAGTTLPFHIQWSFTAHEANFDNNAPYPAGPRGINVGHPSPVGFFAPNAFGLYDMHGNVWEWCQDWFDAGYYARSPECDPQGPESSPDGWRVVRGGSWVEGGRSCRSACRGRVAPDAADDDLGFRVVLEV